MSFIRKLINRKHLMEEVQEKEEAGWKHKLHEKGTAGLTGEELSDIEDNESEGAPASDTEDISDAGYDSAEKEYEIVEREILPEKIICPDCGGITLEGLDFCDKCGGEL